MKNRVLAEPELRRILFCTDFSENADLAFEFAVAAAMRHEGAILYILHVIPEPDAQFWKTYVYEVDDVDAKAKHDIDAKISEAYLARVASPIDMRIEIRIGRDAAEILDFAAAQAVDLIVMGRQGHNLLGKMLFGSVTETVTHKATCPVLVVPNRARRIFINREDAPS